MTTTEPKKELTKIEKLEAKLKAARKIEAQKAKAQKAKEKAEFDRINTRQKVLIGEMMLAAVKSGAYPKGDLDGMMSNYLTDSEDRILFGLAPLTK